MIVYFLTKNIGALTIRRIEKAFVKHSKKTIN